MEHAEVLTVGNSAQPPPTGTSDGSIDLGVGLKTNPSPPFPSRSPPSPSLHPPLFPSLGFGRAPRLEDPSPLPPFFFYLLFHHENFGGPKRTNCPVIVLFRFSPPPLLSPFRVFTAGPVGSRYYCVFLPPPPSLSSAGNFPVSFVCHHCPLSPPPPFDDFVSLVSRRFFLSRDEKF